MLNWDIGGWCYFCVSLIFLCWISHLNRRGSVWDNDFFLEMEKKMENDSILLAPQMRHILASLDSVASAADRIQKEA